MKHLIIALLIASPVVSNAEFLTGNHLLSRMQSESAVDKAIATGYVMGVFDNGQNASHCASSNVSSGQARDVVKKFLEENPSVRDYTADILTVVALSKAWPCPEKKKGSGA
jgi:hypothetical protein